jgi:hypothetical protein
MSDIMTRHLLESAIGRGLDAAGADESRRTMERSLLVSHIADAIEAAQPKSAPGSPSSAWDTSKGRQHVVVAFWGVECTVEFHRDKPEAEERYDSAVAGGADVFYAETKRMYKQGDGESLPGRKARPSRARRAARR